MPYKCFNCRIVNYSRKTMIYISTKRGWACSKCSPKFFAEEQQAIIEAQKPFMDAFSEFLTNYLTEQKQKIDKVKEYTQEYTMPKKLLLDKEPTIIHSKKYSRRNYTVYKKTR